MPVLPRFRSAGVPPAPLVL